MVLLYTLKKQKQKLKMHGLGPFVINEITNGGAVRLETLDGEPMGTFINGSRLKHFHEPLTNDMLERMHAAKSKKLALQQLKADAQAKARERAAKAKARRMQIFVVKVKKRRKEAYTKPLIVPIGISSPQIVCSAILDFGADVNVLSREVYHNLSTNKLLPSTASFNSFTNDASNCHGILSTTIYIQGITETCTFYVLENTECAHEAILGRNWMAIHKCVVDWEQQVIHLSMNNQSMLIPQIKGTKPKVDVSHVNKPQHKPRSHNKATI